MTFPGMQGVEVICIRATDNAGNNVVQSQLIYNGPQVLAAFLATRMKH